MRRAIRHHPAGTWVTAQARTTVTLPFDERHRRRIVLQDDMAEPFLLDLPHAVVMDEGDGLELEGGEFIRVSAATEKVVDFAGGDAATTARLAWHVGNRHVPLQVMADGKLRIREDHVIVAMLEALGARIERREAPFTPERGAYAQGAAHAHFHSHAEQSHRPDGAAVQSSHRRRTFRRVR